MAGYRRASPAYTGVIRIGIVVGILASVLGVLLAALLAGVGWTVKALTELKVKLAEIDRDLKAGARRFDDHETRLRALENPD